MSNRVVEFFPTFNSCCVGHNSMAEKTASTCSPKHLRTVAACAQLPRKAPTHSFGTPSRKRLKDCHICARRWRCALAVRDPSCMPKTFTRDLQYPPSNVCGAEPGEYDHCRPANNPARTMPGCEGATRYPDTEQLDTCRLRLNSFKSTIHTTPCRQQLWVRVQVHGTTLWRRPIALGNLSIEVATPQLDTALVAQHSVLQ